MTDDVKRVHPALYRPAAGGWHLVDVPELAFLEVDGHGDPNTVPAYRAAVEALFTLSYAVRAAARVELGRVHVVGPLEGLWSAADPRVFRTREKSAWDWTLAVHQPPWITPALVGVATARAEAKLRRPLDAVRFASRTEGRCAQVLHVGPYDAEGPVLAELHEEYLPTHGLVPRGRHHEVYLSDARRTAPAKLRTVLRQPVGPAGPQR